MTLGEARKILDEIAEQSDYTEQLKKVPLLRNNRLKACLGRCWSGHGQVDKIELSGDVLDAASRADVREILIHEASHAIVAWRYPHDHVKPHGVEFQREVLKLGGTHIGPSHEVKFDQKVLADKNKYILKCKKCGMTWSYKTCCDRVKNAKDYECSCGGDIYSYDIRTGKVISDGETE